MRVLVCGSRDWKNRAAIHRELSKLPVGSTIIHGACRGADELAEDVAFELGLSVAPFPADWKTHGKSAGPKRNTAMLKEGKPDIVYAFHEHVEGSKGTKNMVAQAKAAGVHVEIFRE